MYSLKVLKHLDHPDGRNFEPGHDCHALSPFEVAELVTDYPDYFKAADTVTEDFLANTENVAHLAEAVNRTKAEQAVLAEEKALADAQALIARHAKTRKQ